jgi:hypothetical protein
MQLISLFLISNTQYIQIHILFVKTNTCNCHVNFAIILTSIIPSFHINFGCYYINLPWCHLHLAWYHTHLVCSCMLLVWYQMSQSTITIWERCCEEVLGLRVAIKIQKYAVRKYLLSMNLKSGSRHGNLQ